MGYVLFYLSFDTTKVAMRNAHGNKNKWYTSVSKSSTIDGEWCWNIGEIKSVRREDIIDITLTRPIASFVKFLASVSFNLLGAVVYYHRISKRSLLAFRIWILFFLLFLKFEIIFFPSSFAPKELRVKIKLDTNLVIALA